jgi:hypothetical protein
MDAAGQGVIVAVLDTGIDCKPLQVAPWGFYYPNMQVKPARQFPFNELARHSRVGITPQIGKGSVGPLCE